MYLWGFFQFGTSSCKAWSVTYPGRGRAPYEEFHFGTSESTEKAKHFFLPHVQSYERDGAIHGAAFVFQCYLLCLDRTRKSNRSKRTRSAKLWLFFNRYSFTVVSIDSHTLPHYVVSISVPVHRTIVRKPFGPVSGFTRRFPNRR